MSPAQRDIRRKQQVLEYAKQSGNVRKTCWHYGILRSLFYVWRRALGVTARQGWSIGARSRDPIPRRRPEIVDQVLHPRWTYHLGPSRIVWYLARYHGVSISDATACGVCQIGWVAGPSTPIATPTLTRDLRAVSTSTVSVAGSRQSRSYGSDNLRVSFRTPLACGEGSVAARSKAE